jgi:hypothetical protein
MTIWCTCIACWIPKATNTNLEYVILIAFPPQQWLHERITLLRCKYIACRVELIYLKAWNFNWCTYGTVSLRTDCIVTCEVRVNGTYIYITIHYSVCIYIYIYMYIVYSGALVSTRNTFQDLLQLCVNADNTERYIQRDIRVTYKIR